VTSVTDLLVERLGEHPLPADREELLLAALLGEEDLAAVVGGGAGPAGREAVGADSPALPPPAGAYLTSVTVAGFRGIGPAATLRFEPGPGLTVVCGRNGSGKSSFAEGLEALLTGSIRRLEGRSMVWKEAWRGQHGGPPEVTAGLTLVGARGRATVRRRWDDGAKLEDGKVLVEVPGEAPAGLERLGWGPALGLHRPFLSHSELEVMLAQPSDLHDQLNDLLGLEDLKRLAGRLAAARKQADDVAEAPGRRLPALRTMLEGLEDTRAADAARLLAARTPDLDALRALAQGTSPVEDPAVTVLDQLRRLSVPSPAEVDAAADRLEKAVAQIAELGASQAGDDAATAELLEAAVAHHRRHGDGDCPVCGHPGALDAVWLEATSRRITELRADARSVTAATGELTAALTAAHALLRRAPAVLAQAAETGLDATMARDAWQAWTTTDPAAGGAAAALNLAAHLRNRHPGLHQAVADLAEAAAGEHERRQDRWIPAALDLAAWCDDEDQARTARSAVIRIKAVEEWLRTANHELRNARLAPYVEGTRAIWAQLRQESNVDIVDITLTGSATRRAADIAVTVDGNPGSTVGVLSQGEVNALALSVFLPRATAAESPLRFVVIDDPVQAMDPSKVDGMARVLAEAARDRQVIVFTHDDRLPAALRYLDLPARIVQVIRHAESIVEVHPAGDPAAQHLDDARALLADQAVPEPVAGQVVPNLCRTAVEAVCFEIVRRRRLSRGDPHQAVEDTLTATHRLVPRLALAIFDDPERAGDVYTWLNNHVGVWATDLVKALNTGSHHTMGSPRAVLERASDLVGKLRTELP